MDFIRTFYYLFMTFTGLADRYRNQQFFPKPRFVYEHERLMIGANFGGSD